MSNQVLDILVLPGDGIGREVMAPAIALVERVSADTGGPVLRFESKDAGAGLYKETGTALPNEVIQRAEGADAILLGAMGLPGVFYPDGREIAPQVDLREIFGLYAGLRPVKTYPGLPLPLSDPRAQNLDFMLIRESTEGLFAGRGHTKMEGDAAAVDIQRITRKGSERLFHFAFKLAQRRKADGKGPGHVTCVDKANILGGFAFFRKIFGEVGKDYPGITGEGLYVDAAAMSFVRNPWRFDVIATENMYGDILSDIGAALMGGMGMAPSADIGDKQAVFQPCHGTAPDIMGSGKANPTAMILSAAMMLDWLGEKHSGAKMSAAGQRLTKAVESAYATGQLRPYEMGGTSGLKEIVAAVSEALT